MKFSRLFANPEKEKEKDADDLKDPACCEIFSNPELESNAQLIRCHGSSDFSRQRYERRAALGSGPR